MLEGALRGAGSYAVLKVHQAHGAPRRAAQQAGGGISPRQSLSTHNRPSTSSKAMAEVPATSARKAIEWHALGASVSSRSSITRRRRAAAEDGSLKLGAEHY